MAKLVPNIKLSNGQEIPQLGFGTAKATSQAIFQAVKSAIDIGYRHFDSALVYANETEVGEAIRDKINEGVVCRKDVFITSKVWNSYHSKNKVVEAARKSLFNLQLQYLDLYLIHYPMGFKEGGEFYPTDPSGKIIYSDIDYVETWKGMEECQRLGLVRSIGLSNFNSYQFQRVWESAEIKPVILQVECHPYFKQETLIEFCKQKNVAVTAFGCLGSPARTCASIGEPVVLEDPVINKIAKKINCTPAQVILRYLIQRGLIIIPKSVTRERIQSNFNIFDFELTLKQTAAIENINQNIRLFHQRKHKEHPHYPFKLPS